MGFEMTKEDSEYRVQEPSLFVYFVVIILGSGLSIVLATYFLGLSPLWLALLLGAILGAIGLFLGENIVEAIILCFPFAFLVFFLLKVASEIEIIRVSIVPIATGFCVGRIVAGIWRELT
jgi:hypothetical protein